ncbi:4Fe-4S binding protein [Peptoniphilus mikwangii]
MRNNYCLYCGNCLTVCPTNEVKRR